MKLTPANLSLNFRRLHSRKKFETFYLQGDKLIEIFLALNFVRIHLIEKEKLDSKIRMTRIINATYHSEIEMNPKEFRPRIEQFTFSSLAVIINKNFCVIISNSTLWKSSTSFTLMCDDINQSWEYSKYITLLRWRINKSYLRWQFSPNFFCEA